MATETIYRERREQPPELRRTGAPAMEPNVHAGQIVRDAEDGRAVMYVARFPGDLGAYRRAALGYPFDTITRMGGTHNNSRAFGNLARAPIYRRNGCRPCDGARLYPQPHEAICATGDVLADHLVDTLPEREADREVASVINQDWKIGGWWTSGVLNYDSPLPYHFDANNLACWSAMVVLRRRVTGGHLHIPAYDAVVECRDGDVLYFPGYEFLHAVTPILRGHGGYRITAVYYTVRLMRLCEDADVELERGRNERTAREDEMLERQAAEGLYVP